jgi:hypothetical protein
MRFDVRIPIGLLFVLIGAAVAAEGVLGDPKTLEAATPGLNIDGLWGAVMVLFGVVMLVMSLLAAAARRRSRPPAEGSP